MRRNKFRNRAKLAPLAAACFLTASGPVWGTSFNFISDTWLPPGGGTNPDWLNPSLWSTGSVPNDDSVNKYLVTIPGSDTVNLDNDPPYTASSSTVYDLDLGGGSTLNVEIPLTVEDAINGSGANINVIGTTLTLAPQPTAAGNPANIYVQEGGSATLAYSTLTFNNGGTTLSADGISAGDTGSVLDLHTVQTITDGVPGDGHQYQYTVSATNGGSVNLSGLTSIQRTEDDQELNFNASGGGTINLNSLQTVNVDGFGDQTSRGRIDTDFNLGSGTSITLPALTTAISTQFNFTSPGTGQVNVPVLGQFANSSLALNSGDTFYAPKLTDVDNSNISIAGGSTLTTGAISDIDNASISVSAGAVLSTITATSISMSNSNSNTVLSNGLTLSADGSGTVLDLHTVQTITDGVPGDGSQYQYTVSATNGGSVNLSGLTSIVRQSPYQTLNFDASTGGTINLNALQTVNVDGQGRAQYGTQATFNVGTNGTISVGGSVQAQYTQFNVTDSTGNLVFQSNVNLGSTTSLNLAGAAVLQVKGSFSYAITNTSAFQASGAILNMNGNGLQTLEVAGADEGAVNPGNNGNFGFGQLEIGQPTVPTEVDLVDDIDNGNRGAGNANEALYLYGVNGQGGLVLNGGSVLLIGNLNAYSFQDGSWTDLQNLFAGNETIVPYTLNGSDGYIARNLSALQAVWQNPGNGAWNTGSNWNINTTPGIFNDVFITPVTGVTVTGPTSSTRIRSLTIDATPSGTLSVLNFSSASTITVEDNIDIGSQGQINEQAGSLSAQQMTVAGSFSQSANTALNLSGGLTSTGGVTSAASFTVGGAFVNNGTYIQSAGTANIGSISGIGSTNVGPGVTLNVGSFTQLGGLVSSGIVNINGSGTVKSITGDGALTINGGTLQLAVNAGLNSVSSLSIGANAALDIGNSRLLISYGNGKDPITSIAAWIKNGFFGLPGPAIISSDIVGADAASGLSYGIGYADSADPGNPADLPSGTVEIMFTLLGDANLDGTVNSEDFTPFSHNLGQSGMMWDDGDFNYDGTVNAEDFTPFSHNLNQSAVLAAQIGVFDAAANGIGLANVPEPACAGMMVMAGLGIMRRRRRAK